MRYALTRSPYKTYPGVRFRHPTLRTYYTYSERSAYDPTTQINQMWFMYERCNPDAKGPEHFEIQLSHRYFFTQEIQALLKYNGFEIEHIYGDFDDAPLDGESDSMVIVARSTP